jgi:D-sedoheptulose 7-phosphate isomerase
MLRSIRHPPDFTRLSDREAMAGDVLDPVAQVRATLEASARVKLAVAETLAEPIARAGEWVASAYRAGGKTLLFGNGGSAADAQHIAAEWVGKLGPDRAALPSIALSANTSDLTAIGNDYGFERVFARGIEAHGRAGDVAIAISTSGNSPNVIAASRSAPAPSARSDCSARAG